MIPLDELRPGDVVTGGEGDLARLRQPFQFMVTRVSRDGDRIPGGHVTVIGVIKRHRGFGRIISVYGWAGQPVAIVSSRGSEEDNS